MPHRAITRLVYVAAALAGCLLAIAPPATAEVFGGGYSAAPLIDAAGRPWQCNTWSGGTDAAGNHYVPCGGAIYRTDVDGRLVEGITLPPNRPSFRDVAPTPDGSAIYYISGDDDIDAPDPNWYPNIGQVVRMVRGGDGIFRQDPNFNVGPIQIGNLRWSPRGLATDQAGNVYMTVSEYVFVYRPDGSRAHAFGGDRASNPYSGGLEVGQGIAVTPDGMRVYVVEQRWNHIQRWDYDPATGAWNHPHWRIGFWGAGTAQDRGVTGDCVNSNPNTLDRQFASPYDVGLDAAGMLYVADTTCHRIVKFNADSGALVGKVWGSYPREPGQELVHGFSVDWKGNVTVVSQGRRYVNTNPPGPCVRDRTPPRIASIAMAPRTTVRTVSIAVLATDECGGALTATATGDVDAIGWVPLQGTALPVSLRAGDGNKTVMVTVRDAAGNVSAAVAVGTVLARPTVVAGGGRGPMRLRTRVNLPARAASCARQPLRLLANPRSWRIVDACASYTGRVMEVRRSGAARMVRLRLTMAVTKLLYVNARVPVTIWVVGSSTTKTPRGRAPRRGGVATITSTLIVPRRGGALAGAPAYAWRRS